ncbi:Alpha/Beta hydrolase protein [Suillus paluster]|uniref:Alpha/Beta hydrolase protein n=1 Tax=Suillus paluster TaxID=48578 RepID=UPI001B88600A|nr:Alpha/Beta hydrolase protein [Suillus paluster]KAG1744584.1 Alpha/Beta hydrolase protein [Suillus paluster]
MASLKHTGPSTFYTELAELPVPVTADFVGGDGVSLHESLITVRDHERNTNRSLTKTFPIITSESDQQTTPAVSHDSSEVKAFITSPSKSRQALLREITDGTGAKRFVEIWAGTQIEASLDVTKYHDIFHTDEVLSSLSFSPSETSLLYTAEANVNADDDASDDPYPKFRYTPHFGEPSRTKKRPTIFLFRWTRSTAFTRAAKQDMLLCALSLAQVTQVPVLFGQATFATEDIIFATGYDHTKDGRILGVKWCFNRPTGIWELRLPESASLHGTPFGTRISCNSLKLTPLERSCRSPRVLYDDSQTPVKLFWLSNPVGGAHASCVSLESRDLTNSTNKIIVDTVMEPTPENHFPGLYTEYNMPSRPFVRRGDHVYIALHSTWHSRTTVLFINTETGAITEETKMHDGEPMYSWNVLATDSKTHFICSRSTPTAPSEVLLGYFDEHGNLSWKVLDKPMISVETENALSDLTASIILIGARPPTETLVIQSKTLSSRIGPKPVCVTFPHGGPHSTSTTAFTPANAALALEGYTISLPNYTGSMGFGEKYIRKLLGHCGTMDVEDVVESVNELIRLGISEHGRQVVQGGSHGGFLSAHLIGQYPNLFNAAVMRNPVISVGELTGSDIPDWIYAEFGLEFAPQSLMTPITYQTLFEASPIAHVDRVRAPVLLLLGEDDLRVVPTQGMRFYHALKGRDRRVEMLTFPKETHPLDGVEAARVSWEAGRDWFKAFAEEH